MTKEAPKPEVKYELNYPAMRYQPSDDPRGFEYVIVKSSAEERELGPGWYKNPGDFGVEINPGKKPDPQILANRKAFEASKRRASKSKGPMSPESPDEN